MEPEDYNIFDHNFSLRSPGRIGRSRGQQTAMERSRPDPGGEGAGFWFRGPNNRITNNVAANGERLGFGAGGTIARLGSITGVQGSGQ